MFLIWLRYWSGFRHSDKRGYCSLYIHFYKLLWLTFYFDFFLNLGFYYNDVAYRHRCHKYYNRQHISIRKSPCFIICMTASPAETSSVTSGLRVSVQPAEPALPIRFLCEELPSVYVFSAHKVVTTFCAPFPHRISHFKILALPLVYVLCSLLTQTQGSLAFPVVWK